MNINAPVNIAEIKAKIIDDMEYGITYDQVYEDLAECFYEGFTEDEANQFGSFKKFLNAVNFENIAKEMANFHN